MNKVTLLGNLVRDPEMNYGNYTVAKTSIAVNNRRKKDDVMFVEIVFFDKLADIANQYLKKGDKLCISGRLDLSKWTDQNGNSRQKHSVIVEDLEMLGSSNKPQNKPQNHSKFPTPDYTPYNTPDIVINEDEIPF